MDQRALVGAHELDELVLVLAVLRLDDDLLGVDIDDRAGTHGDDDVARVDGRAVLEAGADERRLGDQERHGLPLHVRAHERAVRVVVLEERDQRRADRDDLRRRDVHVLDVLRGCRHRLAARATREHRLVKELAGLLVDRLVRLRDRELLLLGGVEVDDLVRDLALLDHAVRRLDKAELGDRRHGGERADQADVRALRRLDRAHAPVVGHVDVAHFDRRALARETTRAEGREPSAVREARERVRLVHELRELRGAEELLQRRDDGTDVDDRLRRDRVDVLCRHPLADDPLHAVEADAERLLDQLADRAKPAVAEVLVLVELVPDRLARERQRVGGVVLRVLGDAEADRQVDEPLDERDDVLRRQDARVVRDVDLEALVQLVAADLRQVVALGVEEEAAEEVPRVLERRRLAGPLLLEDLDDRLLLAGRRVLLERHRDEGVVAELLQDRLVRREVELLAGRTVDGGERAQEGRDRELALPVDPRVDDALLVDLELEPRAAARHQVRDEDLLVRVLRLHQVGTRGADELRDDDALRTVDDEGALFGHEREVAHEDALLADLARLFVDETNLHVERGLVGQVLFTTLADRGLRVLGELEPVVGELHGERAGVVLDRRDVVDGLAKAFVQEPPERGHLDVDQIWKVEDVLESGEVLTGTARSSLGGQEKDPPSRQGVTTRTRAKTARGGATRKDSKRRRSPARASARESAFGSSL